jgi:serine/threonine-protein kinase
MTAPDTQDLTGLVVDRYAIVALVAAGGQGRVYRAHDERFRRDVAIKVAAPGRSSSSDAGEALAREATLMARLNDPHVAGIYDFVRRGGRDYMVMEFVGGATVREILARGPLPAADVVRLGAQLARGLASAHAARVLHRDIKPSNLKVTSDGQVKILDFGVAALMPPARPRSGANPPGEVSVAGTVPYMAPERLRGEEADERSDIFSAGVVLYEMATGAPAFPQRDLPALVEAIQHASPPRPSQVNPRVPAGLEAVIMRAMAAERQERFRTALELAAALDTLRETRVESRK